MTKALGSTRRPWVVAVGMVAASLLTGACAVPEQGGAPRVGAPARPYAAATLAGDTVALESLRGQVVLLNFWATWCAPCRAETPYLQEMYSEHRARGLEIVGVSMDTRGQDDAIRAFVEEYGVTYTILHDPSMRGLDLYQVLGLPATFLIDRDGTLRWLRFGPIPEGDPEFLAALDAVL